MLGTRSPGSGRPRLRRARSLRRLGVPHGGS